MKRVFLIFLIGMVFLMGFTTANVTCSTNSILKTITQGQISGNSSTFSCTNNGNNTVTISSTGSFFSVYPNQAVIQPTNTFGSMNVIFNEGLVSGTYSGSIFFSDGSTPISTSLIVNPSTQTGCNIDIFPTILSNIKIQQGGIKTRNIQLNVPSCYPSSISLQGISLASDEQPIQLGEISLGTIQPGNSVIIPLDLDAVSVSVGQYSDTLQLLAYNSTGNNINLPSVSISVLVTQGISPISNFSLSELPTCSLNAVEFNLNSTGTLICSRNNPNIKPRPVIDTFYLEGLSVTESPSQYIYNFKAKKIGNTKFKTEFVYLEGNVGKPFEQEIRITASGSSPIPGTVLDFIFYQSGNSIKLYSLSAKETIIQIVDNQTKSLVQSSLLYLGGVQINNTLTLESGKNYNLRASAPGYLDLISSFNVSENPITITISPGKELYYVGEPITITTLENASILINNVVIPSFPYNLETEGNITIKAVKEGYTSTEKRILVKPSLYISNIDPQSDKIGKGDDVLMNLNQNVSWSVTFNGTEINSGVGDRVTFTANDYGLYEVKSEGLTVFNKTIEKGGTFDFIKRNWLWGVIGIIVVFIGYFFLKGKSEGGESINVGY